MLLAPCRSWFSVNRMILAVIVTDLAAGGTSLAGFAPYRLVGRRGSAIILHPLLAGLGHGHVENRLVEHTHRLIELATRGTRKIIRVLCVVAWGARPEPPGK